MNIYDLHTHTTYSDGEATVDYLIARAKELGYGVGISDHLFCDGNDTVEDIVHYLDGVSGRGIPVGGEANIGEDKQLSDALVKRFNYIIASVHAVFPHDGPLRFNNYFGMRSGFCDSWEGYDRSRAYEYLSLAYRLMEHHVSRYRTDILGHCCVMPFYDDLDNDSPEVIDWEKDVVALCGKYGVAMEISTMWHEPYERMLRLAKKNGLKFSLGSDCHTLAAVCDLSYSLKMVRLLNLTDGDLFVPKY